MPNKPKDAPRNGAQAPGNKAAGSKADQQSGAGKQRGGDSSSRQGNR